MVLIPEHQLVDAWVSANGLKTYKFLVFTKYSIKCHGTLKSSNF